MGYVLRGLFGERSLTEVAGFFAQKNEAEDTMKQILGSGTAHPAQVRLLGPQDADPAQGYRLGRTLEPESAGIARTVIQRHVVAGMAGAMLGLAVYFWLLHASHPLLTSSPWVAFIAIVGFATALGLLLGGLVTLRPDHVRLISHVRSALRQQQWAVVAHPLDARQAARLRQALEKNAAEVVTIP